MPAADARDARGHAPDLLRVLTPRAEVALSVIEWLSLLRPRLLPIRDLDAEPVMRCRARVLVVGDHPAVRRLVSVALSQLPIDVQETSPAKAHEYLDRGPPHVVVLDLHAPIKQALGVRSRMPRDLQTTLIPTIFLLPGGDDRLRALARAAGATACLYKPFRIWQLQETVWVVLDHVIGNGAMVMRPRDGFGRS